MCAQGLSQNHSESMQRLAIHKCLIFRNFYRLIPMKPLLFRNTMNTVVPNIFEPPATEIPK